MLRRFMPLLGLRARLLAGVVIRDSAIEELGERLAAAFALRGGRCLRAGLRNLDWVDARHDVPHVTR
jgi:hypothetical protein